MPLIAEDLGVITPGVEALRDEFSLPGMRVLQFGFDADPGLEKHLPHRYVPPLRRLHRHARQRHDLRLVHCRPRWRPRNPRRRSRPSGPSPCATSNTNGDEIHWDMIRLAFASVADTAIIPMQDILGLDSRARMNFPGKREGNWGWRFQTGQIDRRAPDRLAELTAVYGRWNGPSPTASTRGLGPRRRPPDAPAISARAH